MSINIEERYKIIFENYRFASEYRIKLITGWAVIYAALAAASILMQAEGSAPASGTTTWASAFLEVRRSKGGARSGGRP